MTKDKMPDDIPDTLHEFQIDLLGSITKRKFAGEFVCKIPTIKDQALIGKHEAYLNGEFPVYLNESILKVHKRIAYLKYTLVEVPRFWKNSDGGYELRDPNIIEAVYDEVIRFEEKWYLQIWGEPTENGPEGEEEKEGPPSES